MQIRGFHIDGFGLYHNQGVQDLPGGLILFTGENESGKTTLMEFIRTVLFGFPRKGTRNDYPPLGGGNHGGRLQVAMQDGRLVTIERLGRQATLAEAGGGAVKGEPGERLLGGLDRITFERVFAVGLKDLNGLDILSLDGVRNRLFAAGAGLGSASVPEAVTAIDRELGNLLIPTGKKQLVYLLMQRLQRIEARINELRGLAATYAASQRRREELAEQIRQNRAAAEEVRQRLYRLGQLEQAREPWAAWLKARDKARELEFARNFPANGLARLTDLMDEIDQLQQQQKSTEDEAARLEGQMGQISPDEALLRNRAAIESLLAEREKLACKWEEEYPEAKTAAVQAEEEFHRRLRELGPDWDPARLAGVDTSVPVRHQVQELGRAFAAAERRLNEARARLKAAQQAAQEAQSLAEEVVASFQGLPLPPIAGEEQLRQKQEAVRRMRQWLQRREVAATQLADQMRARDEAIARLASLSRQLAERGAPLPWWLWIPILAAGLALGGVFYYQKLYVPAGAFGGSGLGVALLFFWLARRQARAEGLRLENLAADLDQVEQNRLGVEAEIGSLDDLIAGIDASLTDAARNAGVARPAELAQLEVIAAELEDAAEALRKWRTQETEAAKARGDAQEARGKLDQAAQEAEQAQGELAGLQEQWREWLAQRSFSQPVRPEGFEAVLQAVETARSAWKTLEDHRRRLAALEEYLDASQLKIRRVLAECGQKSGADAVRVADLDALRRALAAALELEKRRVELQRELAAARQAVSQIGTQRRHKETELQELLKKAGADDEEEFRRRAAAFEQLQAARHDLDTSDIRLLTIAGQPEARAVLETELSRTDPWQLLAEKEDLQERLRVLTEAMDADNRAVGNLNRDLDDMTRNEELGQLLLEQRILQEQLAEAVKRWATLSVCRHLLEQARSVYERERQPQVIKEADRYLGAMAGARYRLVATLGEAGIRLEDRASLKHTGEVAWSAGLADQVFLAIRLGLAREFSRHSEPLPVILDDVLVKFDPGRRLNAARVILEFSREQQVLMFSCHPEFQKIFGELRRDPELAHLAVTRLTIADGVIYPAAA